jgi:hypothetical protein
LAQTVSGKRIRRDTFGKESLLEIIRQHASVSSQKIVSAIIRAVTVFAKTLFLKMM